MTRQAIPLTTEQALALRLRGQGLLPDYPRVQGEDVTREAAEFTGGLQSQDLFAATLGVRVRAAGSRLADVERSRLETRTVVWTWLMRGTLHLVPAEDLDWLLAVFGPPLIQGTARRRGEIGLTAEVQRDGLKVILDRLAERGPATREELSKALAAANVPNGYSIERYLLFCAALEGRICYGPDRGQAPGVHPTYTLLPDWLGRPLRALTGDEVHAARVRLARRYLAAFAPATLADFATWTGLNVRDLRDAWDALADEVVDVEVAGQPASLPAARLDELDSALPFPVVRLLPAFDTYILGHRKRELIDDGRYGERLQGGGMLPATVLVDGRIAGTWQPNRKGRRIAVTVEPFAAFDSSVEAAVQAELRDIERFVGAGG